MNFIFDINAANFDDNVLARSHEQPVVLDIGADWCGPCQVLTPLLEQLAIDYDGQFMLAKVDADENMGIAGHHQAKGFPTVIGYSHGLISDRFHGVQNATFLRDFLDQLIARHASQTTLETRSPATDH